MDKRREDFCQRLIDLNGGKPPGKIHYQGYLELFRDEKDQGLALQFIPDGEFTCTMEIIGNEQYRTKYQDLFDQISGNKEKKTPRKVLQEYKMLCSKMSRS